MSTYLDYSSPINVSSRMSSSPRVISISSDTPPARESSVLSYAQATHWPPVAVNRRVTSASLAGASGVLPAHVSRASISSHGLPIELELTQLRDQYTGLQSENAELKGRYEALK